MSQETFHDGSVTIADQKRHWKSRLIHVTRPELALRLAAAAILLMLGLGTAMEIHHTAHATPATPPHFTIFLHYDYMVASDHTDAPDPVGIQMVVQAFKKHNIDLIIDPHHTAIPDHKFIAFHLLVNAQCQGPDTVDFFALKKQYFHQTVPVEHYVIFANYSGVTNLQNCTSDGLVDLFADTLCQTGISELPGTNFVVSLGCQRDIGLNKGPDPYHRFRRIEAGAFMHELGHNLGLEHGGSDDINYKPNYLSVMNYLYEEGIPRADSIGSNVPDPALTYLDYSEQALPIGGNTPGALDTTDLNEPAGLGSGSADVFSYFDATCTLRTAASNGPVDWDGDGTTTNLHAAADLRGGFPGLRGVGSSCQSPPPHELLLGFDDWTAVRLFLSQNQRQDQAPLITHVLPTSGPAGTTIKITGINLTSEVYPSFSFFLFSGTSTWTGVSQMPDGSFHVTVPSHAQSGPILVYTTNGIASSRRSFTVAPTIVAGFSPSNGSYGTPVTITGTGLQFAQSVQFGDGATATPLTSPTTTTVVVSVPLGARSGPLVVTTPSGPITTDQSFMLDPPAITSFAPLSAATGDTITIFGTDLADAPQLVSFGPDEVFATPNDDGSLTVVVPQHAPAGPITVTNPLGSATSSQSFTLAPATVTGFSPASGKIGDSIAISGMDLNDMTGLVFNGCLLSEPVTFTLESNELLTTEVPDCATTGPVTLITYGGTATPSAQIFTVVRPQITGFSPASGPAGTTLTITGTNLQDVSLVDFNSAVCEGVPPTTQTDDSLTVVVPDCALTGPISVSSPIGGSTSSQVFTVTP
jgi:hypothetical protein